MLGRWDDHPIDPVTKRIILKIYAWLVAHKIYTFFLWFQDLEQHLQHLEALMIKEQEQIKVKILCFFTALRLSNFLLRPRFSEIKILLFSQIFLAREELTKKSRAIMQNFNSWMIKLTKTAILPNDFLCITVNLI